RVAPVVLALLVDVAAGGEGAVAGAGDDDAPDLVVRAHALDRLVQLGVELVAHGVELLRPIQRDDRDALGLLDDDVAYPAGGATVLTRIDHVMICVPDLNEGIAAYTRIGFRVFPGGSHAGRATHNAIAFHGDDYLELLSLRDGECDHWAAVEPESSDARLAEYLSRGGGFRYVAVQSDDLAADVAAMRRRGADVSDATEGGRRTPAGQELRWKA